jgi:hypothetical protein
MIQYIIAAGIGAFLGSQSKKSKKFYAEGGYIEETESYYTKKEIDEIWKRNPDSDEYSAITLPKNFNWKQAELLRMQNPTELEIDGNNWLDRNGYDAKKYGLAPNPNYGKNPILLKDAYGLDDEGYFQLLSMYERTPKTIQELKEFIYPYHLAKGGLTNDEELQSKIYADAFMYSFRKQKNIVRSNKGDKVYKRFEEIVRDKIGSGKNYAKGGNVQGGSTYAEGGLVGERIIFVETDMQFVGETATVLDRKKGVLTVKLDDNGTRNDGKIVYVDVPIAFWEGQVEVLLQKNNREELLKYLMYKYDEDEAKIKRFIKYYENAHDKPYPSNNYMIKHIKSQLNDENFKPFTWEGKEQSVVGYTLPYNDYAKGGKTRKKRKK